MAIYVSSGSIPCAAPSEECSPNCTASNCASTSFATDVVRFKISRGGVFDDSPTFAVCVDPLAEPVDFTVDYQAGRGPNRQSLP